MSTSVWMSCLRVSIYKCSCPLRLRLADAPFVSSLRSSPFPPGYARLRRASGCHLGRRSLGEGGRFALLAGTENGACVRFVPLERQAFRRKGAPLFVFCPHEVGEVSPEARSAKGDEGGDSMRDSMRKSATRARDLRKRMTDAELGRDCAVLWRRPPSPRRFAPRHFPPATPRLRRASGCHLGRRSLGEGGRFVLLAGAENVCASSSALLYSRGQKTHRQVPECGQHRTPQPLDNPIGPILSRMS